MVCTLLPTIWAYALVALWRKLRLQGQVKTSHANIDNFRVLKLDLTIRANKNPFSHTPPLGEVTTRKLESTAKGQRIRTKFELAIRGSV